MARREIQEINASSMADIAFLLLIFFLVSTTMNVDSGLERLLPPMQDEAVEPPKILDRNLLEVFINKDNNMMVEQKVTNLKDLRRITKEFIMNPQNKEDLPVVTNETDEVLGDIRITKKHVISLKNDRGTSYETYITVHNELTAAYNELKNELALEKFNMDYIDLDQEKKEAIDKVLPMRISEAEPN
jgi:biopolymer transport protein ExbD